MLGCHISSHVTVIINNHKNSSGSVCLQLVINNWKTWTILSLIWHFTPVQWTGITCDRSGIMSVCVCSKVSSGQTTKCAVSLTPSLSARREADDSELHLVSLASPPGGQSLKTEDNNMHGGLFEMAVKACLMASAVKIPFLSLFMWVLVCMAYETR